MTFIPNGNGLYKNSINTNNSGYNSANPRAGLSGGGGVSKFGSNNKGTIMFGLQSYDTDFSGTGRAKPKQYSANTGSVKTPSMWAMLLPTLVTGAASLGLTKFLEHLFKGKPEPEGEEATSQAAEDSKEKTPSDNKKTEDKSANTVKNNDQAGTQAKKPDAPKYNPFEHLTADEKIEDKAENYNNFVNNSKGYKYDGKTMDLTGQNLGQEVTFGAFNLNNSSDSTVQIGGKLDTSGMFARMQNQDSDKGSMDLNEFMQFHEVYTTNAQGKGGRNDYPTREKEETVNMDSADKAHLTKLFGTMDKNNDGKVSEDEYNGFNTELLGGGKVVTRKDQEEFINKQLGQNAEVIKGKYTEIANANTQLKGFESQKTELNKSLDTANSAVTGLNSELTTAKDALGKLDKNDPDYDTKYNQAKSSIEQIEKDLAAAEKIVSETPAKLDSIKNAEDEVNATITKLYGEITELKKTPQQ